MMSGGAKRIQAQESTNFPPMGSAHHQPKNRSKRFEKILHLKGFFQEVCPQTPKEPP
jgi:hypothetical protein